MQKNYNSISYLKARIYKKYLYQKSIYEYIIKKYQITCLVQKKNVLIIKITFSIH